ncbi:hypothetical protein POM88_035712 [Heracleum sosnowskyi]|uniref:DDE Tnp4 domain-containing protein n=1 Tax=Heracleum sosnowskyi TaxID=360622 RepID=A0AAD8HLU5_9APIA|nr:hypothetical protein POM88_035712 [Heracleum sosnowskyi]
MDESFLIMLTNLQNQLEGPTLNPNATQLTFLHHHRLRLSTNTLATRFSLEPCLISKITNMLTRLLATKLYPQFVSRRRLNDTTKAFQEITSLPNICGALDTIAVKIMCKNVSHAFLSKHGFPSVLLQVVPDHNMIFWDVCVKSPGGYDDATHFRDSFLYNRLISGDLVWDKVMNVRGHHSRHCIVGDWCYPCVDQGEEECTGSYCLRQALADDLYQRLSSR